MRGIYIILIAFVAVLATLYASIKLIDFDFETVDRPDLQLIEIDFNYNIERKERAVLIDEPAKPEHIEQPDIVPPSSVEAYQAEPETNELSFERLQPSKNALLVDLAAGMKVDLASLKPIRNALDRNVSSYPEVYVRPFFPLLAKRRQVEGYVIVSLTVGPDGRVVRGSPKVVEASPRGYFEDAALKAAKQLRYKPQIVDGVAIETPDVRFMYRFDLDADT